MSRAFVLLLGSAAAIATVHASPLPAAATPTFTKDVAPIVFDKCVSCHRKGEVAPLTRLDSRCGGYRGMDRLP